MAKWKKDADNEEVRKLGASVLAACGLHDITPCHYNYKPNRGNNAVRLRLHLGGGCSIKAQIEGLAGQQRITIMTAHLFNGVKSENHPSRRRNEQSIASSFPSLRGMPWSVQNGKIVVQIS